jgi:hypothetical protein
MTRCVRAGLTLIAGAGIVLAATPASAGPQPGACPRAFFGLDLAGQIELVQVIDPSLTPETAEQIAIEANDDFDRNGDDILCFREVVGAKHENDYIVIDNNVRGR